MGGACHRLTARAGVKPGARSTWHVLCAGCTLVPLSSPYWWPVCPSCLWYFPFILVSDRYLSYYSPAGKNVLSFHNAWRYSPFHAVSRLTPSGPILGRPPFPPQHAPFPSQTMGSTQSAVRRCAPGSVHLPLPLEKSVFDSAGIILLISPWATGCARW